MPLPSARIGKFKVLALPACPQGSPHILTNRPDNRNHNFWPQLVDGPAEAAFAFNTCLPALCRAQAVYWFAAQVDEIAFEAAKRFKEVSVFERW